MNQSFLNKLTRFRIIHHCQCQLGTQNKKAFVTVKSNVGVLCTLVGGFSI